MSLKNHKSHKNYAKYLLILIPALFCVVVLIRNHSQKIPALQIPAVTEDDRTAWLLSQGWDCELHSSRIVVIPDSLDHPDHPDSGNSENINNFNYYISLQESQNLPFREYAGANGIVYYYQLHPANAYQDSKNPRDAGELLYAELLTADGILIGAQCYHPGEDCTTLDMQGNPVILN